MVRFRVLGSRSLIRDDFSGGTVAWPGAYLVCVLSDRVDGAGDGLGRKRGS